MEGQTVLRAGFRRLWSWAMNNVGIMTGVLILLVASAAAVIGPAFAPESYTGYVPSAGAMHPHLGWRYLFGSDVFGHSILAYVILGARTTWGTTVGASAIALAIAFGLGSGMAAIGRPVTTIATWVSTTLASVPAFPLMLVLAAYVGRGSVWRLMALLGIVAGISAWGACASTLANRAAALHDSMVQPCSPWLVTPLTSSTAGTRELASDNRILPALIQMMQATLTTLLVTEATIEFLGFGPVPPAIGWGSALTYFPAYLNGGFWWWMLFPGLAITVVIVGIRLAGEGLGAKLERSDASAGRPAP